MCFLHSTSSVKKTSVWDHECMCYILLIAQGQLLLLDTHSCERVWTACFYVFFPIYMRNRWSVTFSRERERTVDFCPLLKYAALTKANMFRFDTIQKDSHCVSI